jgi:phage/plasmid-associated DNA primase
LKPLRNLGRAVPAALETLRNLGKLQDSCFLNAPKRLYKKKLKGMEEEWQKLRESKINSSHKASGCLTGEVNGVLVLDFDDGKLFDKWVVKFPEIDEQTRIVTKKGYHIYFKWNDKYTDLPSKILQIDIQGNGKQVIFAGSKYQLPDGKWFEYQWDHCKELSEMSAKLYDTLMSYTPKQNKPKLVIQEEQPNQADSHKEAIVRLIGADPYLTDRDTWMKIVWAMRAEGFTKEFAIEMSKKAEKKYSDEGFDNVWNYNGSGSVSMGTLRYYARLSDPEGYSNLCALKDLAKVDGKALYNLGMAEKFAELAGDDLIYKKGKLYVWYKDAWRIDDRFEILRVLFAHTMLAYYAKLLQALAKQEQTDAVKLQVGRVATACGNCSNAAWIGNTCVLVKSVLASRLDHVSFDDKRYLFAFTNNAYDFKKNRWVGKPSKFDYVLTNCGHAYKEPTQTQMEKIKKIFGDIFPNQEHRRAYISVLKQGMLGVRDEKFVVATGEGRNGKGLITENYTYLLGDYAQTMHLSLLTKPIKEGANTELRNLHKKRFIVASEPEEGFNEQLRSSNIKALTGNEDHNARGLYETDDKTKIFGTIVMECNKLPYLRGEKGTAIMERIVIIPFKTTFTNDESLLKENPDKYKPQVKEYKELSFKEGHYSALFKFIVEYEEGSLDMYIPHECKKLGFKWLADKDEFSGWFHETYMEDKDSVVSIKDIYREFKCSDFWNQLNKAEQRSNNEKNFKELIRTHFVLKKHFKSGHEYVNGVQLPRDSLVGFKLKPNNDSDVDYDSD